MPATNQDPGNCNCGAEPPCLECGDCCIVEDDVTLSPWAGGTLTLFWDPVNLWWRRDLGGDNSFLLTCNETGPQLIWFAFDTFENMSPVDFTCDPLHFHFHSTLAGPADYYVDYP